MEYEYGSKSATTAGLTTGIIGTALGVLNGGLGLFGNGVTNYHNTEGGHESGHENLKR